MAKRRATKKVMLHQQPSGGVDDPLGGIRARLVDILRHNLVGPGPQDDDLARERLSENPPRWYLTGFIALAEEEPAADDPATQEEEDREAEADSGSGAGDAAGDDEPSDAPAARRRFLPSSIGLTVLLPMTVDTIEARVSWGDYVTEPPLPEDALLPREDGAGAAAARDHANGPKRSLEPVCTAMGSRQRRFTDSRRGSLQLATHAREFVFALRGGRDERVRAVTVFLVNRAHAG